MKKFISNRFSVISFQFSFILVLVLVLFSFNTCKTDFSVNAGWKDITVVYGILDQSETTHYIRVNKAFLGVGNALLMARSFDSTNYPKSQLDVKLLEYINNAGNLTLGATYPLTWDTIKKDIGTFYDPKNPEQTVYTTDTKFNVAYVYQLLITNLKTGKTISGLTKLVSPNEIITPSSISQIYFIGNQQVEWYSATNGKAYQLILRFHFDEINKVTEVVTPKTVDLQFPILTTDNLSGGDRMKLNFKADEFFYNLSTHIAPNTEIKRKPGKVDYIFLIAGDDLNTYININLPSNSVVQEKPEFTNINNGIGIFSSRYTNIRTLTMSTRTIDTLVLGRYTKNLGFYNPNNP